MKKLLLVLIIAPIILFSCKKDETNLIRKDCNCGIIINDGISEAVGEPTVYWINVENKCTKNIMYIEVNSWVYIKNGVGDDYCVSDTTCSIIDSVLVCEEFNVLW